MTCLKGVVFTFVAPGETAQAHQVAESVAIGNLRTVFETLSRFLG